MSPISLTDRSNAIFHATISWYKTESDKAKSQDFLGILQRDIQELEQACTLAASYFLHSDNLHRQRIKAQHDWNKGLQEQQNLLDKMMAERPAPAKPTETHKQYDAMMTTQKNLIAATSSNIAALKNMWNTENSLGYTNREDMLHTVQLFVALNIDRTTYQKLADAARTIVGSIPDISLAYTIINGTYDLVKIWMTPPSPDSRSADNVLLWLEKRREMLLQLRKCIKAFGMF